MKYSLLATSLLTALAMTACGGGGGSNVKDNGPPPTSPPPPPPPTTCTDSNATNNGGALPCQYRYNGLADNALVPINADRAQAAGYTGKGVRIGVLDDALVSNHAVLENKIVTSTDYTGKGLDTLASDNGHGNGIAALIAGTASGTFKGGVAPDARIDYAQICHDDLCQSSLAKTAFDDLTSFGVRIFNLSLGTGFANEADAKNAAAAWEYAAGSVLATDGLLVASTGNSGKTTAGYPAASPVHESGMAGNVLAVAAVEIGGNGQSSGLASYSNACGDAAAWCVVAPGSVSFPGAPNAGFGTGMVGTSAATALVTGSAAAVSQAFPWMGGNNIQQTLLTTATDLGTAGVDSSFGWGLVNVDKAVKGPGAFIDAFDANVSGESTFANAISGSGSLVKSGAGTLILTGNNTFAGGTTVNAGILGLAGNVSSSVQVNDGGTLRAQGGSIGGDYTASGNATTSIQLGQPLTVAGKASLDGTLNLRPEASTYAVGATEKLIGAGSVVGQFDAVTYANDFFWKATVAYTGTSVDASMTRLSATASAQSFGAAQSVVDGGKVADSLVGTLDGRVAQGNIAGLDSILSVAGRLLAADQAQATDALTSLTAQVHGAQRTANVQGALNTARLLADRLPLVAGTEASTAWVEFSQFDGSLGRSGYLDSEYRQQAITVGVDLPVSAGVIGASFTKGDDRTDVDGTADRSEGDRAGLNLYGYMPVGSAYFSGSVGYTRSDLDTTRYVMGAAASANRTDSSWDARIESGFVLDSGLTPYAAVGRVRYTQAAFSEVASNGLGISAGEQSDSVDYADAGLRLRHSAGSWTVDALVAYRAILDGDESSFGAWFTDLPDAQFDVTGQPLPDNAIRAAFGVGYAVSKAVELYGAGSVERAGDEGDAVSAQVGLRWSF